MAVRYAAVQANHGFDGSVSPNWQMVPVGGTRVLKISGAAGLVPRVKSTGTAPVTATVSGTGDQLRLTLTAGRVAGAAKVEWVSSAGFAGTVTADFTLHVSVKAEKKLNTAFHYVNDGRKQVTTRKIADLDKLIAGANAILTPQANVTLLRKSAAELKVAQNLGEVVRYSLHLQGPPDNVPAAEHEWDDLLALADTAADFNVFFVKEYEQDNTPAEDNDAAGTMADDKMCVFEDQMTDDHDQTLAHETMHRLGFKGHNGGADHVMAAGGNGRFIPRDHANLINPSGT